MGDEAMRETGKPVSRLREAGGFACTERVLKPRNLISMMRMTHMDGISRISMSYRRCKQRNETDYNLNGTESTEEDDFAFGEWTHDVPYEEPGQLL